MELIPFYIPLGFILTVLYQCLRTDAFAILQGGGSSLLRHTRDYAVYDQVYGGAPQQTFNSPWQQKRFHTSSSPSHRSSLDKRFFGLSPLSLAVHHAASPAHEDDNSKRFFHFSPFIARPDAVFNKKPTVNKPINHFKSAFISKNNVPKGLKPYEGHSRPLSLHFYIPKPQPTAKITPQLSPVISINNKNTINGDFGVVGDTEMKTKLVGLFSGIATRTSFKDKTNELDPSLITVPPPTGFQRLSDMDKADHILEGKFSFQDNYLQNHPTGNAPGTASGLEKQNNKDIFNAYDNGLDVQRQFHGGYIPEGQGDETRVQHKYFDILAMPHISDNKEDVKLSVDHVLSPSTTPESYDDHGFGQNGFGDHGFDEHGFGDKGFGEQRFEDHGFDQQGIDGHGFGEQGLADVNYGTYGYADYSNDAGFGTFGGGLNPIYGDYDDGYVADARSGFGSFGSFSTDTNDCDGIETRTCTHDAECSCYGFYICSHSRCTTIGAANEETQTPIDNGFWHEEPVGFGDFS